MAEHDEIGHELGALLGIAAELRSNVERLALHGNQSMAIGVQQLKALVGDWDSKESAQTRYDFVVKQVMEVLLSRAIAYYPGLIDPAETKVILKMVKPGETAERALHEISIFVNELDNAKGRLGLRLLALKYNLAWPRYS